jgi:NADH-quinone oxidoreductase subunit J
MAWFSDWYHSLTPQMVFFFVFAALAVGSALEVVMQRNPLYSAIALIFTFAALAANYVLLKAQFIAAIQIIVYAGAIIVLFVFVIMLLNVRSEESRLDRYGPLKWIVSPSLAVLFLASFYVIRTSKLESFSESSQSWRVGQVETIGKGLFTSYLLPFEAASVLIMMAIVGALVLAQRVQRDELVDSTAADEAKGPLPPSLPEHVDREEVEV